MIYKKKILCEEIRVSDQIFIIMDVGDNQFLKGRSSTRLHAPPGGNTSICFGSDIPLATHARPDFHGNRSSQIQQAPVVQLPAEVPKSTDRTPVNDSNNYKKRDVQTSVRVRQPPGGSSSIFIG